MFHSNSYLNFIFSNKRFLGFGFFMLMASSVGQTYFIGIFGPAIRGEFNLTHTSWAGIYMMGTLLSAAVLPYTGKKIDDISLTKYTKLVILLLFSASVFIAFVPSITFLVFAIFLLRHSGQGLMSHTGTVAMARYFYSDRGKALAIASMGFSFGEMILPVLMVIAITAIGWRWTYGITALVILLFVLPLALWLLKEQAKKHEKYEKLKQKNKFKNRHNGGWTRRKVLKDFRFYVLMPAALATPFVSTALFFHHLSLAELKGWDAMWFAANYWIYALGAILAMLISGPLIDKFTALQVLPVFLLPLAIGLLIIWKLDDAWWAWPYLFLLGVSTGISHTGFPALWAEVYGVNSLGAIKSLSVSLSVFASALGPLVMGLMLDNGIFIEQICLSFSLYCLISSYIFAIGLRFYRQ